MEVQFTFLTEDDSLSIDQSQQQSVENARQLKNYFIHYYPEGETKQLKKTMQKGDGSVALLDVVVQVLLGKNFMDGLMGIFKEWISKKPEVIAAKKSKIQLEVKDEQGKTKSLTLENVKDIPSVLAQLQIFTSAPPAKS